MSTAIATKQTADLAGVQQENIGIRVALNSNLAGMPDAQIWDYYKMMCQWLQLDPMSHPFDIITTTEKNGNVIKKLYPNSICTAQLGETRKYNYSAVKIEAEEGLKALGMKVARVSVEITSQEGRTLVGESFIDLMSGWEGKQLSGNNLTNALKKAATQARRRGTLQMAGLAIPPEHIAVSTLGDIEENGDKTVTIEHPPATALLTEAPEEEFTEEERAIYQSAIEDEVIEIVATQEEFIEFARERGISSKDYAPTLRQAAIGEITWTQAIAKLAK